MKDSRTYDAIVVGAGPAGLSAARTAARLGFSTLVLEQLPASGQLDHPCSAIISPVPHSAFGSAGGDLYFRKIDLTIPQYLVLGYPEHQRMLGPDGYECTVPLGGRPDYRAAVIDKSGLLRMLADQASSAGAELHFKSPVTGLLSEDGRVRGVQTERGEYYAQIVLSAEGLGRRLCSTVLPPSREHRPARYGFVIGQELQAPAVQSADVGQLITLGRRYTSARDAIGLAVAPAPGHLSVFFALFADGPNYYTERSAQYYLDEYMHEDPRVRDLCQDARTGQETISRTVLGSAPRHAVADGFMGLGDAVTPGGYLGILPAVHMGRQAALVAAEALEAGDTSAHNLALYEAMFRHILPDMDAESQMLAALARMTDSEIAEFCRNQNGRPWLPFSAHTHTLQWNVVGHLDCKSQPARPAWNLSQGHPFPDGHVADPHPAHIMFRSAFA